ncbi:hypothetical protein AOLI_G00200750 [Acnodon oligacanthus]
MKTEWSVHSTRQSVALFVAVVQKPHSFAVLKHAQAMPLQCFAESACGLDVYWMTHMVFSGAPRGPSTAKWSGKKPSLKADHASCPLSLSAFKTALEGHSDSAVLATYYPAELCPSPNLTRCD